MIDIKQTDLEYNRMGVISPLQHKTIQQHRTVTALGLLGMVSVIALMIVAGFYHMYLAWLPCLYWLWILRHSWKRWQQITKDIKTGLVVSIDGWIRHETTYNPGLIRLEQHKIQIGELIFDVEKSVYTQFQPIQQYRIYYTPNAHIFVGAIPLTKQEATAPPKPSPTLLSQFTQRELEVLALIAEGLSNKEIAQELHLSVNTIKMYTSKIYRKLGVNRRAEAVLEAREVGLVP